MDHSSTADHLTPSERERLLLAFPKASNCISNPGGPRRAQLLRMPLSAFFTQERLRRLGPPTRITRVLNAVNGANGYELPAEARTVGDLVNRGGYLGLLRTPDLGHKCMDLMRDALAAEGIELPDRPYAG